MQIILSLEIMQYKRIIIIRVDTLLKRATVLGGAKNDLSYGRKARRETLSLDPYLGMTKVAS